MSSHHENNDFDDFDDSNDMFACLPFCLISVDKKALFGYAPATFLE